MSSEKLNHENEGVSDSVFILGATVDEIDAIEQETLNPWHEILANSAEFIDWATYCFSEGLEIYSVPLDSEVPRRLVSPALIGMRHAQVGETWSYLFKAEKESAKNDEDGMEIEIKPGMRNAIRKLKARTKLDSEIIFNHSPFMFHWAIRQSSNGIFIAALNEKKEYDVWDSKYNKRYTRIIEEKMIDMVDPKRAIAVPILAPIILAA